MRLIDIAGLARMLHARQNPWKALVLLNVAYFDETGAGRDRLFAGYAGYCATRDDWDSLEAAWAEALTDFRIPYVHMVELVHQTGPFEKTDMHWVQLILERLSRIISEHNLRSIWCGVDQVDWNDNVTADDFLARFPKPLDLCFDGLVHQLRQWSVAQCGGSPVVPIFADSKEYSDRNREAYQIYKRHPHWEDYLGAIAFASPKQVLPLQASDMIAYELGAHFDRLEDDYFAKVRTMNYRPTLGRIAKPGSIEESYLIDGRLLRELQQRFSAGQSLWTT